MTRDADHLFQYFTARVANAQFLRRRRLAPRSYLQVRPLRAARGGRTKKSDGLRLMFTSSISRSSPNMTWIPLNIERTFKNAVGMQQVSNRVPVQHQVTLIGMRWNVQIPQISSNVLIRATSRRYEISRLTLQKGIQGRKTYLCRPHQVTHMPYLYSQLYQEINYAVTVQALSPVLGIYRPELTIQSLTSMMLAYYFLSTYHTNS